MTHSHLKAVPIANEMGLLGAIVVAEHLFIQVAEQMEWLDAYVCSLESTLNQAPEVFQSVGMDLPVNVLFGMVDDLVLKALLLQSHVGHERIGIDRAASFDVGANVGLQKMFFAIADDTDANLATAFKNALNGSFVFGASMSNPELALIGVHVSGKATDESFIHLYFFPASAKLDELLLMQGKANAVHHEPSGLLSDSQSAGYFIGTDSILAINDHPYRDHPLVHTYRGILKDGSYLDRELLLASLAEPMEPRRDERMLRTLTAWASDLAIRPAEFNRIVEGVARIGEENNCFLQRSGKLEFIAHE
jgi:hypothetical protein